MRHARTLVSLAVLLTSLSAAPLQAQQNRPLTRAPQPGATADAGSDFTAMKRQLAAMQKQLGSLRSQLAAEVSARETMQVRIEALRKEVDAANGAVRALRANSVLDLNGYVSFDNSSGYPTVLFNGINLQVVNGTGATQMVNGLGNLILGYNRPRSGEPVCSLGYFDSAAECSARGGVWARSHKSGSHNLVGGDFNGYASWGGVVFGLENVVTAPYATILGGAGNRAVGDLSAVNGGSLNTASGMYATVGGGLSNNATGAFTSVGGGNARSAADSHDWTAGALTQDR
jgi:hypothetical protein